MDAKSIIGLWPSVAALAAELQQKPDTVRKWRVRNSIPADMWLPLVKAAEAHGYPLTLDHLAEIAASRAA